MTNEQILKGIIIKAKENGWEHPSTGNEPDYYFREVIRNRDYLKFIFSPSFAKAVWGEKDFADTIDSFKAWEYHLQQMVLDLWFINM